MYRNRTIRSIVDQVIQVKMEVGLEWDLEPKRSLPALRHVEKVRYAGSCPVAAGQDLTELR